MSRTLLKINELKRVYMDCSNPLKDEIISRTIINIKSLAYVPDNKL